MSFASLHEKDESGNITKEMFDSKFREAGVSETVLNLVFNEIDTNGDGDITVMEFTKWQHSLSKRQMKSWKTGSKSTKSNKNKVTSHTLYVTYHIL